MFYRSSQGSGAQGLTGLMGLYRTLLEGFQEVKAGSRELWFPDILMNRPDLPPISQQTESWHSSGIISTAKAE
ncbi:hypothetical protein Pla144_13890 [Bythopirellula polymerisocia]|uniref:Uncharacterized protein n=1 Tax=Bythopirellula polymerisocia TaxID=2528003 RepID=A0A5C6CUA4_9BACT|nr:hypothetical protein Pla144_13890 [Bythopirellula polymerisocia]